MSNKRMVHDELEQVMEFVAQGRKLIVTNCPVGYRMSLEMDGKSPVIAEGTTWADALAELCEKLD